MKKWILIPVLALLASPLIGQQLSEKVDHADRSHAVNNTLPSLSELNEGWNTLRPGGKTICAEGSEYVFFTRVADPKRLVVYLHGGGGCWDAETCNTKRDSYIYTFKVEPRRHPRELNGIFELKHPDNPVADYSMVVLPVCTGDAFLGDRDMEYMLKTDSGEKRKFTIHHRGQTNTMAVFEWIYDNFQDPEEIFIAGSSAGAIGTPFYGSLLAQHYPEARVYGLGDDSGSYGTLVVQGTDAASWGIPEVLNRHRGWGNFKADHGIENLFINAAQSAPNLELYQVDHANDRAQRFYMGLANVKDQNVSAHLRTNRKAIQEQLPEFRSFTTGGYEHTVLTRGTFYYYQTKGQRLSDWVTAIVKGEPVSSVDCFDDCEQPGLIYTAEDLLIIDRAKEILSTPGAWNPDDGRGACDPAADSFSIRCAVVKATEEITGRTPRGRQDLPPGLLDLIFTITAQAEDKNGPVLIDYNNNPENSVEDMISILEVVKKRIQNNLDTKP